MANTIRAVAASSNQGLNLGEVSDIASELQPMVGAQLQECVHADTEVGLGFYHRGETVFLWFDLDPRGPVLVRSTGSPPSKKKITRPLSLFIRSRFLGRRLATVRADLARGRVLVFSFHRAESEGTKAPIELEVRLIPHAPNLIARDGTSVVSENKPKELPVSDFELPPESKRRKWTEIEAEWFARKKPQAKSSSDPVDLEKQWRRTIEKKRGALEKMQADLDAKSSSVHRDLGEWLKANRSLDEVPSEWREFVDFDRSLSWNIEAAFKKAKDNERKLAGSHDRIEKVRAELAALESSGPGALVKSKPGDKKSLLATADARGRSLKLADDLDCYIGKSAGDNLALLRRAQPFDLWLHLREMPGSHAIIRRTRGRHISDAELRTAGRWVAEQSFGKRIGEMKGQKVDLLIVECRFVRPIKGDKLGRVNYTNDRVMRLTL